MCVTIIGQVLPQVLLKGMSHRDYFKENSFLYCTLYLLLWKVL